MSNAAIDLTERIYHLMNAYQEHLSQECRAQENLSGDCFCAIGEEILMTFGEALDKFDRTEK